jgi:tetratricopeptide (TPR) repeat protein
MNLILVSLFLAQADFAHFKGEAKARMQNIEQNLSDWDVSAAKAELESFAKLVPEDGISAVDYFKGRVAFEEGRYDEAVTLFESAGLTGSDGFWLKVAKDTRDIISKHERVESEHFIFFFPKGRDAILAPWALDALEKARSAFEKDLGWAPKEKIRVEVVANAGELSKLSTLSKEAIKTTGTIAICKFSKLIITSPRAVVRGYDWLDTLSHEYVHLVVSQKSRNTVPIWLHEGLAKYLESRWRGPAGGAMTPSTLALLGSRVRAQKLIPFEKMHPSMALLPTAEDAATAFAEVFFAVDLMKKEGGDSALERILTAMAKGTSDKAAVELVLSRKWSEFEKSWMAHLKKQPFPKDLIPLSSSEKKQLTEKDGTPKPKGREVSFGDFVEIKEPEARRAAHLAELFREKDRNVAAAECFERAYQKVGDKYESISNKYALTLFGLKRFEEAGKVLEGSLKFHPGSAATNVHLGRIRLRAQKFAAAKEAFLNSLAVNPFDPEVFVGLYAVGLHDADASLSSNALAAVMTLMNIPAADVPGLANRYAMGDDASFQSGSDEAVDAGGKLPTLK